MKSYALYRLGDISNDLLMLIQNASPLRWFRVIKYGHWRSWRCMAIHPSSLLPCLSPHLLLLYYLLLPSPRLPFPSVQPGCLEVRCKLPGAVRRSGCPRPNAFMTILTAENTSDDNCLFAAGAFFLTEMRPIPIDRPDGGYGRIGPWTHH